MDLDKILPSSSRHIHTLSLQPHIRPPHPYYHRQPARLTGYTKDSDSCKLGEEIGTGNYDIHVILILARYVFYYPYESFVISLHSNRSSSPCHVSLPYNYKSLFTLSPTNLHDKLQASYPTRLTGYDTKKANLGLRERPKAICSQMSSAIIGEVDQVRCLSLSLIFSDLTFG